MKILTFLVVSFALGVYSGRAQMYGQKQDNCVVESTDKDGFIVYTNKCTYKIQVVWARGNQRWDNYLEGGEVHPTYKQGPFTYYACQMGYLVVDSYDRAISRETTNWACLKR